MADTTLEYIEQLVGQLSEDDQHQLMQKLTQRLQCKMEDVSSRPYGLCQGEFVVPDDFDSPLPEGVIKAFESS